MRPRLLQLAIALLLLATPLGSVQGADGKLDGRARAALGRLRAGHPVETMRRRGDAVDRNGDLDVFVRGSVTREQLEAAGARVRTALPGLFTASIPVAAVDRVEALAGVTAIRGGVRCEPELDVSVPTTGVRFLRGVGPAFGGLNGQGVVVGIVDSGIDYGHGDFDDPSGNTRILNVWDQLASGTGPPGFPYGVECSSAEIDAGTCDEADSSQHGTHIAGIAAGDGSQTGGAIPAYTYAGMAPRADIVAVKTDYMTPEVIDAVSYVFGKAEARGENAVVNLSLGTQYGSHDGRSEFEQGIAALIGPGKIVVKSAGNDRGLAVHAQVFATPGGATATLSVSGSAKDLDFSVDGYYSAGDRLRLRVTTPGGTVIGPMALNTENAAWPGQTTSNGVVYVLHDSLDTERKQVYLEVYSDANNHSMNGTWQITLLADQLGPANGEVDLWRYRAATGMTANFVAGNLATQELITEPGNLADVITVGAYVTKTTWTGCNGKLNSYAGIPAAGNLAPFSSPGPSRDGRQKPDLVAPGSAVGATTSFDVAQVCPGPTISSELLNDGTNHRVYQGTSVAAPHVTGAIALLLQKFGAITPSTAANLLESRAIADGFTGAVPTKDWGYGKLNLGDLVDPAVQVVTPNGGEMHDPGSVMNLQWTASDSMGSVTSVDLQLSRTGPNGPYEDLATEIANTGSYDWTVTGPITGPHAAYVRVVAHDNHGNSGLDLSDAGFMIGGPLAVDPRGATGFALSRVHPNPASRAIRAEFSVAREAHVRLSVRDVQGRAVAVLADAVYAPGLYLVSWDIRAGSARAATGLYFLCYDTPAGIQSTRVFVVR